MKEHPLSELVLDFDLYPRGSVDTQHVTEIAEAIEAGSPVPPLVIDKASKRVVDGFHRWRALRRLYGEDHVTECIEKSYKSDGDLFIDAMRYNASHGRALTKHDKTHCVLIAEELGLSVELVAESLNLTKDRVGALRKGRVGQLGARPVALKNTIRHMAGRRLDARQAAANEKLSGMNATFYLHQIAMLIETGLIDTANKELMTELANAGDLIERFLKGERAA